MRFTRLCPCLKTLSCTRNFCCCFTVETGVLIIGVLNCADLIKSLVLGDLFGILVQSFASCWFFAMVWKDSKHRRMGFLASYIVECLGFLAF